MTTKEIQGATTADESCLELIDEAVAGEAGIYHVSVDTAERQVVFDYDPRQVTDNEITTMAAAIGPVLEERWRRCTMRLEKRGGRACESCALALERQVYQLDGVRRVTASFAGGVMAVHYDDAIVSPADITRRATQFGAVVRPSSSITGPATEGTMGTADKLREWLTPQKLQAILTVVTFIAMMSAWLINRFVPASPSWLVSMLYTIAYMAGGAFGLKGGIESLRVRKIDVDLLMIMAALGAAFVGQPFEGAMLLFLFSLSNTMQDFALDRTRSAIRAMMALRPDEAAVYRGDQLVTLPIEQVIIGDRMLVKPGDRIPLDGVVRVGEGSVDQAAITGESIPVQKVPGDTCFAGTINKDGSLEIGVTRLAGDSTIARLIQMVEEAQSEKAETQRMIDRFEQPYAIGVIVLTAMVAIIPPFLLGESWDAAFYTAMTVMVAASPCAIVISTPATVLSAIGNAARRGVLFKGGVYVESAATIKVVAFDKTGTLTIGEPRVTDVFPLTDLSPDDLLQLAAAVEARSEHPLAQAIVTEYGTRPDAKIPDVTDFMSTHGQGVRATVNVPGSDSIDILIGNDRYFADNETIDLTEARTVLSRLQAEGKTSILIAEAANGHVARLLGIIALADRMREDAPAVIQELKDAGVKHVVMLTGDNQQVAERIGALVGVDEVFADLMPGDKVATIKHIAEKYGPVAMIGDGVNDAPALAAATIGIAMGAAGTDVAMETADIVLMSNDLGNIPYVIRLSHKTRQTLIVNLGFSLFMIGLMLTAILIRDLPLPAAVIGHEGGTVLVSLNGLRMLAYRDK